jgi:hypothetical protein
MLFSLFYLYIKISCLNDFDTNYLLGISQLVINLISSIEEKNEINFYLFLSFALSRTISIDYWIKFSSFSSLLCFYYKFTFDPWKSTCRSSAFTYLIDVFLFSFLFSLRSFWTTDKRSTRKMNIFAFGYKMWQMIKERYNQILIILLSVILMSYRRKNTE